MRNPRVCLVAALAAVVLSVPVRAVEAQAPVVAPPASSSPYDGYTHVITQVGHVQLVSHHLNCNPLARDFDAVWLHGEGWTMPRGAWWVFYPTVSLGFAELLTKVGVNDFAAAAIATTSIALVPDVRQAALGLRHGAVYQLNVFDKLYDLHARLLPVYHVLSEHHHHAAKELVTWAAVDLPLTCFARP